VRGVWQLAHWTADRNLPKRFAVPFFVARMPAGQTPVADEAEQFEPVWIQPQQALDRHAADLDEAAGRVAAGRSRL
jgi:recombination protein RecT